MFGIKCKNNKIHSSAKDGFTIVEILVVMAVFVTAFVSIFGFFALDGRLFDRNRMKLKALSLAEEGIEAVRFVRDNKSWPASLAIYSIGFNYHPVIDGSSWNIIAGNENINGFTRAIVFNSVSRDANDNIENVYNPANNDPNTRKVIVVVSWVDKTGLVSESLSTYLTNWK